MSPEVLSIFHYALREHGKFDTLSRALPPEPEEPDPFHVAGEAMFSVMQKCLATERTLEKKAFSEYLVNAYFPEFK